MHEMENPAMQGRGSEQKAQFSSMSYIQDRSAPGKNNPAGERELLIHALRTAVARSRLVTNALETIGVSLRHKSVTTEQAMAWLRDEGLLPRVHFGPGGKR
jgi:hypothetical protein